MHRSALPVSLPSGHCGQRENTYIQGDEYILCRKTLEYCVKNTQSRIIGCAGHDSARTSVRTNEGRTVGHGRTLHEGLETRTIHFGEVHRQKGKDPRHSRRIIHTV